jgi:acyl-homoserine lactone acylase PvdQ
MRRGFVAVGLLVALAAAMVPASVNAQSAEPPEVPDPMRAFSIVPPGQEGDVTADELAADDFGPHYADQLETYASLVDDGNVTEEELPTYFHSMQFGPEGAIEETYEPTTGATVYRDSLGIPHIYADSMNAASFALGYVTAEDRMWQMDVFRHAARGTLAEFAGAGEDDAFLTMDIETRREGYTEEEVQKMFDDFDDEFGAAGQAIQEGLQAYADGVNAHISELKTTRAEEMPAEYAATGNPPPAFPQEWTPLDTLFLAILQLRVFGETAGGELENAALYRHLTNRLGTGLGERVFSDFLRRNDPRSYTSVHPSEGRFNSQDLGRVNPKAVAIPDDAAEVARESTASAQLRREMLGSLGFKAPASNALLVSAAESATGNPLEIGAPQVGYGNPAFFMDIDVHVSGEEGADFRGPAVPGASALIPLGRGTDYAWSLTTGFSDAVDVRAERLCDPGGGEATVDSNGYVFRGRCRDMTSRDETFVVKPTPVEPGEPRVEERTFYRTRHGPVFARGTVDGKPAAFVKERYFWKKELDSLPQFYRWNTQVDSLADFRDAASKFTMSFNTFYADSEHIAYFHLGLYPERAQGVHPALPVWGTGRWEWGDRFPFRRHPKVVDPEQGWVANWNNKPAAGWDNYDNAKWGPVHRVELLANKMRRLARGDGVELSDIVDVIRKSATQDVRGVDLGRRMVKWIDRAVAGSSRAAQAAGVVDDWIDAGAHRRNSDRDEFLDDGPAIAIFDEWYNQVVHGVFDDELGSSGYGLVPAPVFDGPNAGGSAMWFDFSSYLANVFEPSTREAMARNYCDHRTTGAKESCSEVVVGALRNALDELEEEQGEDMSAWTAPAEFISFQNFGAGTVEDIPWQNRGTHNHVVEILD